MHDFLSASALSLAELIRRREISCEELSRFFLDRIERHNPALMAFASVHRKRALLKARAMDRLPRSDVSRLPVFYGVPCGIKDLVPMRGSRTMLGSRAYRYFISPIDAPTVKLIKNSGVVLLGKLSTSEFGVLPVTEPDIHPPTRNPWNLGHTPGGSSGGSGSAVAAGLLPFVQGSDGGGSIRIPSAFCHLYGFKPSLSLVTNLHGRVNLMGLSVMGPLTHTVEDAAAMIDVLRGQPTARVEEDSCLAACRRPPKQLLVRYGVESPLGGPVAQEIKEAVEQTARRLEALGHRVEPAVGVQGGLDEFLPIWQYQVASVPSPFESTLQPVTRWLREEGKKLNVHAVERQRLDLAKKVKEVFSDADIMLTPTVPIFPPQIGQYDGLGPQDTFSAISEIGAFTALFNVTRQPAANIPAGVTERGLPYGVQLVGREGADREVFAVSKQLEEVMPWRGRRPPGF